MESPRPVVFGEVLFDVFPDGRRVLGGAPFNVAWHLEGFGLRPRFVSRVGPDPDGERVLEAMRSWGMSTAGVQSDATHPTGRVEVVIEDGEPSFRIAADQAYDFIDPDRVPRLDPDSVSLLYHGTLGIRSEPSRQALERLGGARHAVICDLNLRAPWWTRDRIDWCLGRAGWVKLNAGELETLVGRPTAREQECLAGAERLVGRYDIPALVVTRGRHGALGLFPGEAPVWQSGVSAAHFVDSVGAGDAFSAVLILGILRGWAPGTTLAKAAAFAAEVCGRQGATSPDRSIYQAFRPTGQS